MAGQEERQEEMTEKKKERRGRGEEDLVRNMTDL
jgi:hypothetical protein